MSESGPSALPPAPRRRGAARRRAPFPPGLAGPDPARRAAGRQSDHRRRVACRRRFPRARRSGPMLGVHPILGVRDRPRGRKFIPELGRRRSRCVGQAPPDPRRARCLGLHVARGGAGAGSVLGRARAALSLRSENRARLGNRRNQSASYRLKEGDRNGEGLQTGWRTDLRRNARERRGCASRKSAPADPPLAPQPRQVARGEEVAFLPSAATRALFQSARLEQYAAISRALAMIAGTRAGVQEDEDRRIRVYAC